MNRYLILVAAIAAVGYAGPFSGRIIGGHDAEDGEFPYQVSIQTEGIHKCGGSIINDRWILTAGHCIHVEREDTILLGTNKVSEGGQRYTVETKIRHEEYDPATAYNDIGLIKVTKPIKMNDKVGTVGLNSEPVAESTMLTASGWGYKSWPPEVYIEDLQTIRLRAISNERCNRLGSDVMEKQLCTYNRISEGVCVGDSGSPLVLDNGRQAGIVSHGIPCAIDYPDVFTRVSSYIDWINDTVNKN